MNVVLKGKDFPLRDNQTLSTSVITEDTKQSFIRARARETVVRIESTGTGYGWTLGDLRFDIRSDGRR
jgi:hypothetical protein